ncbi:MAG TPA: hypothetical protein VMG13_07485 [Trebonia sp.]|nr:hypothetical protein [Trebonia sp.]
MSILRFRSILVAILVMETVSRTQARRLLTLAALDATLARSGR